MSKNGFWYLFPWEKSPKVSVLEADSFQRWYDSTSFLENFNFSKILAYHLQKFF